MIFVTDCSLRIGGARLMHSPFSKILGAPPTPGRRPCLYTFMSLCSIAYLLSYNICKQQREFHVDFIELKWL